MKYAHKTATTLLVSSAILFFPSLGTYASDRSATETENIMRAIRSWSGTQTVRSDAALVTHSIDIDKQRPNLSRLAKTGHDGLLSGEDVRARWPFYLTAADLSEPVTIKIGFTNAATVLPEASKLHLWINGSRIAARALRAPDKTAFLEARISPQHLRVGENEVMLHADQHHRVDCSMEGSYELWTAIDLRKSTIEVAQSTRRFTRLQDLPAFPRDSNQSVAINIILPNQQSTGRHEALLGLVQQTVLAAKLQSPDFQVISQDSSQAQAGQPGLDLFVGSWSDLVANSYLQARYSLDNDATFLQGQQSNIAFIPSGDGSKILLARLDELAAYPDGFAFLAQETDESVRPLEQNTVSLNELGYREREFQGQRFSQSVQFSLPADFYPADYDSLDFHLYASYARDIGRAELQFLINEKSKISLPIGNRDDGLIENRQIKMPLSAFNPGNNKVELIGLFEKDAESSQCATRINRARSPVFFLSGESYFDIPKLAHLPILPNVRTTLATGYPYRQQDSGGAIKFEIHDDLQRGLKVSANFLARMAINANEVFDVSLTRAGSLTRPGKDNRIIVGSYATIPSTHVKFQDGVDLTRLAQASQHPPLPGQNVDLMPTASISLSSKPAIDREWVKPAGARSGNRNTGAFNQAMPPLPSASGNQLAQESLREVFRQRASKERDGFAFSSFLGSLKTAINPIESAVAKVTRPETDGPALSGNNKALISQRRIDGELTTLVSYDMQASDYLGLDRLFASAGQGTDPIHTVSISGYGDSLIQLKSQGLGIGDLPLKNSDNWHLVFAGWLSNNPPFYAFLTFVSLLVFGLLSSLLLNRTKRSQGDDFEQTY